MQTQLLLFVFGFMVAFSGRSENSLNSMVSFCLEISGNVTTKNNNTNDHYYVQLLTDNKVVQLAKVKNGRSFKFLLVKNRWYAIKIMKKGYAPKMISISTFLPKGKESLYRFHFDTDLIPEEEAKTLNQEALDFPIAVVSFEKEAGWFYYNEEFTANIKREIYLGNSSRKTDQLSTLQCSKNDTP